VAHTALHWDGAEHVADGLGLRSARGPDMPLSTSPMDGLIGPIRNALHRVATG
jgi:hypothetical protein